MITAAINGGLDNVKYHQHPIFNMLSPLAAPMYPTMFWTPRTPGPMQIIMKTGKQLALAFVKNFEKYADYSTPDIVNAGPNT
jgi:phosphoenolpyruvate carboxykinase (ATP)